MMLHAQGAGTHKQVRETPPIRFAEGSAFIMGGFFKSVRSCHVTVGMALRSEEPGRYAVRTPFIKPENRKWGLVWECVAPARTDGRFVLRAVDARDMSGGALAVDGLFFCPVAPLIEKARAEARAREASQSQ